MRSRAAGALAVAVMLAVLSAGLVAVGVVPAHAAATTPTTAITTVTPPAGHGRTSHGAASHARVKAFSPGLALLGGRATAASTPTATLNIPVVTGSESSDTCSTCLASNAIVFLQSSAGFPPAPISVTAAPANGATVTGLTLQYEPAAGPYKPPNQPASWQPLNSVVFDLSSSPYKATLGYNNFTFMFGQDDSGWYNLRAAVTDSTGQTFYSPSVRVVVDDDTDTDGNGNYFNTYLGLQDPGRYVHGTINLLAACEAAGNAANLCTVGGQPAFPATMSFEDSPAGQDSWSQIGTAGPEVDGAGNPITDAQSEQDYTTSFDTTKLADGTYDLTVLGADSPADQNTYLANPVTVTVDNTPPTVSLTNPGSIGGIATLSATASDAGSGVASVRFEDAPAGSGTWSPIGRATGAPYQVSFDTRSLPSGRYDLRAVATDRAGNTATSVVSGVSITNQTGATFSPGSLTISTISAPATSMSLLGEVSGSPDHETWAYGYTTAPPPTVNGSQLPFTATPGKPQLVLLRYTDAGGWQVADVLRNTDGTGFAVPSGAVITGQMTASGEAWIAVAGSTVGVFHHLPGGPFTLDPLASATLRPLLGSASPAPTIKLGQTPAGDVYGMLVAPAQQPLFAALPGGGTVTTKLRYGELSGATWSLPSATLPPGYAPGNGDSVTLQSASPTGAGTGWGLVGVGNDTANPEPLFLGSFGSGGWSYVAKTGLDALDLTDNFGVGAPEQVTPEGILAAGDGVWIKASVSGFATDATVIALYDPTAGHVVASWCASAVLAESFGCAQPLDANHPATVPDAVFDTPSGPVGLALASGFIDAYSAGTWTSIAAPGFKAGPGASLFTDPTDGWLAGAYAVGRISPQAPPATLARWPEANQATLLSVALPAAGAAVGTSGALAVGLDGAALHYDANSGWLVDPVPPQAQRLNLLGVAFDGPSRAVAVGTLGTILDWNGSAWSEDSQSISLTQNQLNAVAFGSDGQGWAVGTFGTILHFNGASWSTEQIDSTDAGEDVTSVTVAGSDVLAIAGGNLIERRPDGSWARASTLPAAIQPGSLTLVSGLPDGGAVVAGDSVVLVRQDASSSFSYSAQPIQGTAVALSAFRDQGSGQVRAFVSVSPPVTLANGAVVPVGGFPPGDGELELETPSGWADLSRSQYPAGETLGRAPEDGAPQPDPVLGVAAASDGGAAWAVGGYAGTQTAGGLGTVQPLQARPFAWQTSSIWRFDAGGSAQPPTLSQAQVSLPAQPNTVSFAFFSGSECIFECATVEDAQPVVNLRAAATEISNFAAQPGGPAFAMLGGNAVGPSDPNAWGAGHGAVDLANLGRALSPLGSVPLYAAYGPLDEVPTGADPAQPWDDTFAQSPAPFGLGGVPAAVNAVGSGGQSGSVHHYYAYDTSQNGGTLRVIVLDNSAGSLDASDAGQSAWLDSQLSAAQAPGAPPVVVVCAEPLDSSLSGAASDADTVAAKLANAGVLAVFTTSPSQSDQTHLVPYQDPSVPSTGAPQIPEYEGAALGYQQTQNNGVLWYFVSVDTVARKVTVQGIPVVQSLALEPLGGLSVARSSTLSFRAVGRRPAGTLPGNTSGDNPAGIANYVAIPPSSCSSCVKPSYAFTSSDPAIGDFVAPSGPGSQFPALNSSGHPVHSAGSGLFCGFNAGTTTVSVTSGLETSSLTVSVRAGPIGQPCGSVAGGGGTNVITIRSKPIRSTSTAGTGGASAPPSPAPAQVQPQLPRIPIPPPAPPVVVPPAHQAPHVRIPPPPVQIPSAGSSAPIQPSPPAGVPPVVLPLIPPALTPVPPGGATVSAQAAARREEKARKHASQSAFVIRPAGTSATDWFYPTVGIVTVLAMLLVAGGLRPGPKPRLALVELGDQAGQRSRRTRIGE